MTYIDGEFGDSQKIKSFAIDGVAPSQENIANGTYSYITTAWLLIRDGEPKDSPAEWIFAWFTGENAEKYITAYTSSVPAHGDPSL
jgi:ABC-type phosphate transport system substrate-binding protein